MREDVLHDSAGVRIYTRNGLIYAITCDRFRRVL